jgi:hypothetical protein
MPAPSQRERSEDPQPCRASRPPVLTLGAEAPRRARLPALAAVALVLVLLSLVSVGCRRPNPAIARQATAQAAAAATGAAAPTATPATALAVGTAAPAAGAASGAGGRKAKIAGGNLGIGATGVAAGIQVWSKAGGVLAGGATMTGTVPDGAIVDVLAEQQLFGQTYYQIRSGSTEGWVEGRFIQLQ